MVADSIETLPDYDVAASDLFWLSNICSAAHLHGLLCAQICCTQPFVADAWVEAQMKRNLNVRTLNIPFGAVKRAKQLLEAVYQTSFTQLNGLGFDFELLLPDDEEDLLTKTQALSEWCDAFVNELVRLKPEQSFYSDDAREAIEHIRTTADINQDILENDEQEEQAYMEILEYIRLSVVLIYMETTKYFGSATKAASGEMVH